MMHREQIVVSASRDALMELIAAIRQGRWPLSEFSSHDAKCFEQAARLIRAELPEIVREYVL